MAIRTKRAAPKSRNLPGQTVLPGMSAIEPNVPKRAEPEYHEQVTLFDFLRLHESRFPALHWVFAIPNGLALTPKTARKAKAQGVKAGVWDLMIPCARDGYPGLWIEMKAGRNTLTTEQKAFRLHLLAEGYKIFVAWNWIDAAGEIIDYLAIEDEYIDQALQVNRKASVLYTT